jgi:hypothetical protein
MADLLLNAPMQSELLRQNRFLLTFPSDIGIASWYVSTAQRPKINISKQPIPFLNTETYVAGRYVWSPLQITFRDPIGPSASQALMEWVRLHAESLTGRMGYFAGYARDIELAMLDPTGVAVSKWILRNCMLTDTIDFGGLNYASDALADITINIQPQYCILAY